VDLRESVRVASRAVRAHKLRSGLTVLGVVIGIASVITVATFGASVQADVVAEIEGSSADNVYLLASPEDDGGFGGAFQPVFTQRDLDRLRGTSGVRRVVPRGPVAVGSLSYRGDAVARSQVTATTPETFTEDGLVAGRAFEAGANEVVVNEAAVTAFEENVTVGSELVAVRGDEEVVLEVVGVASRTEGQLPFASFGGQPRFFVPTDPFYDTAVESPSVGANQRAYPQVTVVADPARTAEVKASVREYLREESDARELVPAGVEVTAQTSGDFVDRIQDVVNRVTRFVTGIAVISLVVGAVGIANIMLVSVTERTREIGVMKAVGARNRDVMRLFLVEAALLGLAGALLGVPLGALAAYGATVYAEVGFTLALDWLAIAVAVGLAVGVLAGVYPAWRAARVDPIDALRYE
jgi:putative ABC transport system permease protein